jgi:hypothetical protein
LGFQLSRLRHPDYFSISAEAADTLPSGVTAAIIYSEEVDISRVGARVWAGIPALYSPTSKALHCIQFGSDIP